MYSQKNLPWTDEQDERLKLLVLQGASAARAAAAMKRTTTAIRSRARQLGRPFPRIYDVRKAQLAREAEAVSRQ